MELSNFITTEDAFTLIVQVVFLFAAVGSLSYAFGTLLWISLMGSKRQQKRDHLPK